MKLFRRHSESSLFFVSLLVGIVFALSLLLFPDLSVPARAQSGTITFGSVGNVGDSSNARAVLNSIKSANLNFFLHVGDFTADTTPGATDYPSFVRSILGEDYAYEIVAGDWDAANINKYTAGLPDKMLNTKGSYGKSYYFDYPAQGPVARIFMIAPNDFPTDFRWLSDMIDGARDTSIPWVVVGMNKNCISMGEKTCEIDPKIWDLLFIKKVDLILQAHDQNYQRSKGLSCAKPGATDQSCIKTPGPAYQKGNTVVVINGTGGNGFYALNPSDPEAGYFAASNNTSYGFTKVTITATQLSGMYVAAAGNFADSFTISGPGVDVPGGTPALTPAAGNPPTDPGTPGNPTNPGTTGTPGTPVNPGDPGTNPPITLQPTYACLGGNPCVSPDPTGIGNPTNPSDPNDPANPGVSQSPNTGDPNNPGISGGPNQNNLGGGNNNGNNPGKGNGKISQLFLLLLLMILEFLRMLMGR